MLLVRGIGQGPAGKCYKSTAAATAEGSVAQRTFEGKSLAHKRREPPGKVLKGHL